MKEQFAGLFQRFLEEQRRAKEQSLIESLEKTSQNLTQLVTFLTKQNKGEKDDINRILMINHPLISFLRDKLSIPYNFYIEGLDDLGKLLKARKYYPSKDTFLDLENNYVWEKVLKDGGRDLLEISKSIFDDGNKLKYFNATSWQETFVRLSNIPAPIDDELPF